MPLLFHLTIEPVLTQGMLTLMFHRLADVPLSHSFGILCFLFSMLYNAFSGVIEDKVKDDLKETVS